MTATRLVSEIAQLEHQLCEKRARLAAVRQAIARGDAPATETSDTFPEARTTSGRVVVKGWQGARLRLARESCGFTKRDLAQLCAANGVKTLNVFHLRLYEEEPKAAPTIAEAQLLATLTHYPAGFFIKPIPPGVAAFGEELGRAIARHSRITICDVCEQESGDDDSRAFAKCDACKLDLCSLHDYAYEADVKLPHGVTRKVTAAHYCPKCYRRLVSRVKRSAAQGTDKTLWEGTAAR